MLKQVKQCYHKIAVLQKREEFLRFVKFGIVGLSNTLISLCVYWLCNGLLQLHYLLANCISFLISVTNSYFWNSRYVFSSKNLSLREHAKAYAKVFCAYGVTFLLGTLLLFLWVERLGISETVAPIINLLITIPLNYVLNKYWAFGQTTRGKS